MLASFGVKCLQISKALYAVNDIENRMTKQAVLEQLHTAYSELCAWSRDEENAGYMSAQQPIDITNALLAAAREIDHCHKTLRVVAGLIHDALPSAQGTAAEALAHAYEAIETTLHGVAVEPTCPCGTAYLRVEGGYVPVCACAAQNSVAVEPTERRCTCKYESTPNSMSITTDRDCPAHGAPFPTFAIAENPQWTQEEIETAIQRPHVHMWSGVGPDAYCIGCNAQRTTPCP